MTKAKQYFGKLLIEVPAILVAVLLALGLSTWKENIDKEEKIDSIISLITQEVIVNYASISHVDTISARFLKEIDNDIISYKEGGSLGGSSWVRPGISNTAWKMAQISNVFSLISPEVLRVIADVYQEQERMEYVLNSMEQFDIKQDPSMSELNKKIYVRNHTEKIIGRYEDLKRRYEKFLDSVASI